MQLSGVAVIGAIVDARLFQVVPPPSLGLGRVTHSSLRAYEQPRFSAEPVNKTLYTDTILKLYEAEPAGDPGESRNPLWWQTDEGWVHSSRVQRLIAYEQGRRFSRRFSRPVDRARKRP